MKKIYTLIVFSLLVLNINAQETNKSMIYFNTGSSVPARIESIPQTGRIKFTSEGRNSTYTIERLTLAFNDFGRYLVISTIPDSPSDAQVVIDKFYSNQNTFPVNDIIFKAIPFEIIPCEIIYSKDAVNYRTLDGKSASIGKENVLAIVRKDGSHEIVRDVLDVVPFLKNNVEKFNELITKQTPTPVPSPKKEEPKPIVEPAPLIVEKTEPKPKPLPTVDNSSKPKLTAEEKDMYSKQSIDNVLTFKDFLNIIGDDTKSPNDRKAAIQSALSLFTPGATVEVTSKNRPGVVTKLPVEVYLRNLSRLSYRSVNITYANLRFISELSQADDGNYYGLVRGEQRFEGYGADGKPKYNDITEKNYKVKVESINMEINSIKEVKWKALLGDVSVSQ